MGKINIIPQDDITSGISDELSWYFVRWKNQSRPFKPFKFHLNWKKICWFKKYPLTTPTIPVLELMIMKHMEFANSDNAKIPTGQFGPSCSLGTYFSGKLRNLNIFYKQSEYSFNVENWQNKKKEEKIAK